MTAFRFSLRASLAAGLVAAAGIAAAQPAQPAVQPGAPASAVFPMTDAAPRPQVRPVAPRGPAAAGPVIAAGPAAAMPAPMAAPMPPQPVPMAQASVSGTLARWLINPNGEADGLLLDNGTQVNFPPHLSADLTALVQAGDRVEVTGWRAGDGQAVQAQQIAAKGRAVVDTPPNPGAVPPAPRAMGALAAMNAGGRIARVLTTGRGDTNGVLLEDGTVVRFPPHVGRMIAGLLQPGAPLYVQGWGTRSNLGTALEATRLGATPQSLQDVLAGPVSGPVDLPRPGAPRRPV